MVLVVCPNLAVDGTCVIVLSRKGEATVVNETGPTVTEAAALRARVRSLIGESQAVALMGSLPPGLPEDLYAEAVSECRRVGVPCLVDTAGPALEKALSAGPTYAKPNQVEAEALLGRRVLDWHAAAQEIRRRGANVVLISRGARAAFLSSPAFDARLSPPAVPVVNPTGAGDALAAGLLAGHLRDGSLRGPWFWEWPPRRPAFNMAMVAFDRPRSAPSSSDSRRSNSPSRGRTLRVDVDESRAHDSPLDSPSGCSQFL
ncbi:MAG: 1-phosphofructokinase family hexose kinase [Vicinamibacteria bacterium]